MAVYLGNKLVLANGVGGTSLANGHAETHAKDGGDPLSPSDIGAAEAAHTHAEYAEKPTSLELTLPKTGWTEGSYGCTQTVSAKGMRSGKLAIVSPAPEGYEEYVGARVYCALQGYGALTFSAAELPGADITVYVLMWG